jgi:hypothetical protein
MLSTAACDPSAPDTDVVLARTAEGQLQLIVNLCENTLDYIDMGSGSDWGHRGKIRITPTSDMQGKIVIDLPDPGAQFQVKEADALAAIDAPFFATVWVDDGELASQAFHTLPGPGEITYVSPDSGDPVIADLDTVDQLQTCGAPGGGQ